MNYKNSIVELEKTIIDLELSKIKILDYLNTSEPIIYLCGKSSSGKTTFLNALFNFDKNELYTSTDISTKTEFRFIHGVENVYSVKGENEKPIPSSLEERKELFKNINKEGNKYIIKLFQEALNGREIVDIPGIFDFTGNTSFSENMLNEADIVYFFTPCTSRINQEYELLKKISFANIPIIVLFTMGDDTDPDEGITRESIPNIVNNRLQTCFKDINIYHHQIISSNDFYEGIEGHAIDQLKSHIEQNDSKYAEIAKIGRFKRAFTHYINLIRNRTVELEKDKVEMIHLIKRENELWLQTEKDKNKNKTIKDVRNISDELEFLEDMCNKLVFGDYYKNVVLEQSRSNKEQKEKFIANWGGFWLKLKSENENLSISIPSLPQFNEDVFKEISIKTDKLKEIQKSFSKKTEVKSSKPLSKDIKEANNKEVKSSNNEVTKKESSNEKPDIKGSETKESRLTKEDVATILIELGLNINNAKILWDKWSFTQNIKSSIEEQKENMINQLNLIEDKIDNELLTESNTKVQQALNIDVTSLKLDKFREHLIKLEKITNDF